MSALFIFLIGLFIGSFLNVVVDRIPRGESIIVGRSHCDFCKHTLSWYDLIPLFSFLFLRGKCRYCHTFIGWKYPVIELTTGVMFALTFIVFFQSSVLLLLTMLGILSILITIFYTDLFSGIIPDILILCLSVFACFHIFLLSQQFISFLLAGFAAGLFFLCIFLLTKGHGIGFGDVKYALVMGLLVGFPFLITSLYIAFLTGAGVALILVIARKKAFKSSIAFGPFLVIGTFANLLWGASLWSIFLHILGL